MHYKVGGFAVDTSMDRARQFFGETGETETSDEWGCSYDWDSIGLSVMDGGPGYSCDATRPVWMVTLTDRRWHTNRGLHVGDSLARLGRLYPKADHEPYIWYIDERPKVVSMRAQVEGGRVEMIYVFTDCTPGPSCP